MKTPHIPVLFQEVLDSFNDVKNGVIVDCTLGYGGHSSLLLENKDNIKLIGIDQDDTALNFSTQRLESFKDRFETKKGRFSHTILDVLNEEDNVNGILADIGVSSLQLDQKDRGFAFDSDSLDMRMNQDSELSADKVVNTYSKKDLERILRDYGELKNYKAVADVIVKNRPFSSAKELSEAIKPHAPHGKKIHPSTLAFQAIRIEVNQELYEIETLLDNIRNSGLDDCLVAVITFHSLEDRIVKKRFSSWSKNCICDAQAFRCECGNNNSIGKVITKKPLEASKSELKANPRSRSAKLRVFKISR